MKRMLRGIALALCLALLLTACGAQRSGTSGEDEEPVERARRTAERTETAVTAEPETTEEASVTPEPSVTDACGELNAQEEASVSGAGEASGGLGETAEEAVRVRMTRQDGGDAEQVLVEGLSESGETVWQRSFATEYRTELTLIEEIGAWKDRWIFNNKGTVTCLSLADGETLWTNEGFNGASISSLIDESNGNVYLCGWYGPDFYALDAEGRTIANYRTAADGFYWPSDMAWNGPNQLVIYYFGGAPMDMALPYYVDLKDFSISWSFAYEEMDADSQYWANIFISDFAEQGMTEFPRDNGSDFELASFAHRFCKINRQAAITYVDGFETVSLDTVNELCLRFFGRTIDPDDGVLYTDDWGNEWKYENGRFFFPAADGEARNRFAVVREYLRLPGGDVMLSFDVYELDLDEYWTSGMDAALYRLTAAEAEKLAASGRITRVGSGSAEALPIEQSGHDGYILYRYQSYSY